MALRASRGADQFMVRMPDGMRQRLSERAADSGRSMNAELMAALQKHLEQDANDIRIRSIVREILAEERAS